MKILSVLLVSVSLMFAVVNMNSATQKDFALEKLKQFQEFKSLNNTELIEITKSILWNKQKTNFAICLNFFQKKSKCYIICKNKLIYASSIEKSNFGKLGLRQKYDKWRTYPSKWIKDDCNLLQIKFITHVWIKKQRYTVSETLILKNGKPLWR